MVAFGIAGCAGHTKPAMLTTEQLAELSVPLDVRELRVTHGGDTEAIFIKLSRLPDGIDHRVDAASGSIVLDIKGPAGGESSDEESLQGEGPLSRIRIARHTNVLRVSLDLEGRDVPPYSVHLLSDWIMIRLTTPGPADSPDRS